MDFETFFIVEEDGSEGLTVRVRPTRYLERMHPHQAMTELEDYIEILYENLFQYQDVLAETDLKESEDVKQMHGLMFELEACQDYLAHLKEHFQTIH
jgi:hypothetical protein